MPDPKKALAGVAEILNKIVQKAPEKPEKMAEKMPFGASPMAEKCPECEGEGCAMCEDEDIDHEAQEKAVNDAIIIILKGESKEAD